MYNNEKAEVMSLGELRQLLDRIQIPENVLNGLSIAINPQEFLRVQREALSIPDSVIAEPERQRDLIVHKDLACKVLGGISPLHIDRGNVDGITSNIGEGTVTIDMSTEWIRKFGVTTSHFASGTQMLIKAPAAAKMLNYANSKSLIQKSDLAADRFKSGGIWLYDLQKIKDYKRTR